MLSLPREGIITPISSFPHKTKSIHLTNREERENNDIINLGVYSVSDFLRTISYVISPIIIHDRQEHPICHICPDLGRKITVTFERMGGGRITPVAWRYMSSTSWLANTGGERKNQPLRNKDTKLLKKTLGVRLPNSCWRKTKGRGKTSSCLHRTTPSGKNRKNMKF